MTTGGGWSLVIVALLMVQLRKKVKLILKSEGVSESHEPNYNSSSPPQGRACSWVTRWGRETHIHMGLAGLHGPAGNAHSAPPLWHRWSLVCLHGTSVSPAFGRSTSAMTSCWSAGLPDPLSHPPPWNGKIHFSVILIRDLIIPSEDNQWNQHDYYLLFISICTCYLEAWRLLPWQHGRVCWEGLAGSWHHSPANVVRSQRSCCTQWAAGLQGGWRFPEPAAAWPAEPPEPWFAPLLSESALSPHRTPTPNQPCSSTKQKPHILMFLVWNKQIRTKCCASA